MLKEECRPTCQIGNLVYYWEKPFLHSLEPGPWVFLLEVFDWLRRPFSNKNPDLSLSRNTQAFYSDLSPGRSEQRKDHQNGGSIRRGRFLIKGVGWEVLWMLGRPLLIPYKGKIWFKTEASDLYWGAILFFWNKGKRTLCGYKSRAFKGNEGISWMTVDWTSFLYSSMDLTCHLFKKRDHPQSQLLRWAKSLPQ